MTKAYLFDFMGVVGYTRLAVAGDPGNESHHVLMFDEVVHALVRLRTEGFKLALVSNNDREYFCAKHPEVAHELDRLFDVIVFSSDVGVDKPNPRIFQHTLELLGTDARDAHYFDDLARNVDAAVALGMGGTIVTRTDDVLAVVS
jgi:putative hydrolase of the HAD superfamily